MSDGRPTVKTATEARQGRTTGVVRWVLGISLTRRNCRHDRRVRRIVGSAITIVQILARAKRASSLTFFNGSAVEWPEG